MRNTFPLFNNHLDYAHHLWASIITANDTVVDATLGNGHDFAWLCQAAESLHVIGFDIQKEAIQASKAKSLASPCKKTFIHDSHANILQHLGGKRAKLVVYNLGYLPGGDKTLTTKTESTLESIAGACESLLPGGLISITCYPGHSEGAREERAILLATAKFSPKEYAVSHITWQNRTNSPSLVLIQKSQTLA